MFGTRNGVLIGVSTGVGSVSMLGILKSLLPESPVMGIAVGNTHGIGTAGP